MPDHVHILAVIRQDNGFGRAVLRGLAHYSNTRRPEWLYTFVSEHWWTARRELHLWRGQGIVAHRITPEDIAEARPASAAIVTVGSWQVPSPAPQAIVDNVRIGRQAAEHFIERGVLRTAYLGTRQNDGSDYRCQGFEAATVESGGVFLGQLVLPHQERRRMAALVRWLKHLPRPVGVMAFDDGRAMGILAATRLAGLRVPDDVAIIGVNDDDVLCELSNPTLTSIDVNAHRVGYEAAKLLDQVIQAGPGAPRPDTVVVPPIGPIIRGSTDVLAIDDELVERTVRLIWKRVGEGLRINDLLTELPISARALERRFRAAIGRTPGAELRRARLQRARHLLVTSDLSVTEIAARCGYRHPAHLNKDIRAHWRTTPLQMRAEYRLPTKARQEEPAR